MPFTHENPNPVSVASQTQKVKILLVDDTPENLVALEAALYPLDEDLVFAHSGTEALRYLLEDEFAAVLLDVRMPDMDGFETAQMIRNRPKSRHTPILFLSKYKSDAQLLRGYDLGAVDFLFTPIVPQVLRSKVSVFVELSRNAALLRVQAQALHQQAAVLRTAEQKFRSLLEAAPDAMIMCREDGEIVLVNSRVESVFGDDRHEIVGKHIQLLVPDWSYQVPGRRTSAVDLAPVGGSERECMAVRLNGDPFPVEITTSLIQAEEGVLTTTAIRDITGRKHTERQIRELKAHKELARALHLTHTMIRNIDGSIRVWTRGAQELYGWTAQEAVGAISHELLRTEFPASLETIEEALLREGSWEGELKQRSKEGCEIFVASHWVLHSSEGPEPPAVLEVNNDVTALKATQICLRESEERCRKVFEESPLGKAFVQPDTGRFLQVNSAFAHMLGYQKDELADLTVADVTYPDDRDIGLEARRRVSSGKLPRTHFVKRYVTKTGVIVWVSVHEALLRDAEGQPLYNLAVIEDITQRKQLEEDLRRRNEELAQFSSIAAHDLLTPLRNIGNSAQFLAKHYQGQLDPNANEFLEYILTGAEQMQELLQALLSYAQSGEERAPQSAVPVKTVVDSVLANLKAELEQTGAEVICEELPVIEADALQLTQLFQNLIENAVKYRGKRKPQITIRADKQQQTWLFSVCDNGIGIAPESRERIFAPLNRLHGREISGTGIGLAICKKIVERAGGRIWVESQPGQGSTFYFTLTPRADANEAGG